MLLFPGKKKFDAQQREAITAVQRDLAAFDQQVSAGQQHISHWHIRHWLTSYRCSLDVGSIRLPGLHQELPFKL